MDEIPSQPPVNAKPDPMVRAVRGLTIAVWTLAAVTLLQFSYNAFYYARMMNQFRKSAMSDLNKRLTEEHGHGVGSNSSFQYPSPSKLQAETFEGKQFHELTSEKKIQYASVILLTKHVKEPSGRTKSIISEIVKQKPGTELLYRVGGEYPTYRDREPNAESVGDGEIVLMVGSPADMRESSSYTGDRLGSMGGMTLGEMRAIAKKGGA
jgi:hypothetical protein